MLPHGIPVDSYRFVLFGLFYCPFYTSVFLGEEGRWHHFIVIVIFYKLHAGYKSVLVLSVV